jgi:hypothetical protein
MRIPLTAIHRAFPELDRFTDEQCVRFIRAACRSRRRSVRLGLIGLTWLVLFAAGLLVAGYVWLSREDWTPVGARRRTDAVVGVAFILAVAVPPLVALLVRDRLLIGRIRRVLRTRGVCLGCRYRLAGLPVSERNVVVCPECGREAEVDPSLSELTVTEDGRGRFTPTVIPDIPRFWTARKKRYAKRGAIVAGVLIFVVLPAVLGGYEVFLRRQAAAARADRIGSEGFTAFIISRLGPAPSPNEPNAWDAFLDAEGIRREIDDATWRGSMLTTNIVPVFDHIFRPRDPSDFRPQDVSQFAAEEALARDLLVRYREGGVFETLGAVRTMRWSIWPVEFGPNQSPQMVVLPHLGPSRSFARINTARMAIALPDGDLEEYIDAFETNLAIKRMCVRQPFLIDALVANAIESLTLAELRDLLLSRPSAEWLDAVEAALDRQDPRVTPAFTFENEKVFMLETIAWTFSEPSRVRFGPVAAYMGGLVDLGVAPGEMVSGRLGTYAANRRAFESYLGRFIRASQVDPFERPEIGDEERKGLILLETLAPALGNSLWAFDRVELDRRATRALIALERHRIALGRYPDTLDALVPGFLSEVPIDPWDGKPLKYRTIDPAGRSFILYSVGMDGADDGGTFNPEPSLRFEALSSPLKAKGFDYLINDPQR